MPNSAVIVQMRQFKASLLAGERTQMAEMASRWLSVERRLSAQMDALALEMANIARDGGTVSQGTLMTQVRYRELLVQLTDELEGYTGYAERTIADRQRQLVRLGIRQAEQAITTQGVVAGFNRLPVEAVTGLVGLSADGSPLRTLLAQSWPHAAQRLTDELINGIALGYNPRKVARLMAQGMASARDRMEVIARTEQLRVYRTASLESYKASGVVKSYVRLSARDNRVCAGCLAVDGEEYDLATEFQGHPQCRCTLVPKIEGIPLRFQRGSAWFAEQPASTQRAILGPGRFDLWANGQFDFAEFATLRRNAIWGDAIVPTTIRELVGA